AAVAEEAEACTNCPLHEKATQVVFGEGPAPAELMLVGEQPGDREDLAGQPFVGPAGRILDEGLELAGIDRSTLYVTNAVKHFKWKPRGKRRIHERPDVAEINACAPWLDREVELVGPRMIVALGATAVRSLLGRSATISSLRGTVQTSRFAIPMVVTVHPSAIVRLRDADERAAALEAFADDLRQAQAQART
ncbi:MAG TPA: UdgX family uracil-DNA binding protein, partial [Acidimicrobiales bacterium]|nr:UdgX family uracil-DNA binding protein [Acidimicrobiales bacterium]